jgi:choline kinase
VVSSGRIFSLKAVILAAGVGARLYGDEGTQPPKALLRFGGKSLLQRHVEALKGLGVDGVTLVVGYRKEELLAEIVSIGASDYITPIFNADFRQGAIVSFWMARDTMTSASDVLFMDADVLYHPRLLERLISAPEANCFLFDQHLDDGEDPVRLCIRNGVPADFGKMIEGDFDIVGEWPGIIKLNAPIARSIVEAAERLITAGQCDLAYEPAMREVLLAEPVGTFGYADISGVPWVEIDFPDDLRRARSDVINRILTTDDVTPASTAS